MAPPNKVTPPPAVPTKGASVGSATPPKDTPPKAGGKKFVGEPEPKPQQKKPTSKPPGRPVGMEKQLIELFEGLAMVMFLVQPDDAIIVQEAAPKLAHAYANLAKKNATVKRILENLLSTSAWSEAAMVTALVALPIAQNHIPALENLPIPKLDLTITDEG